MVKDNKAMIYVIIIVAIVILWGGSQGWFKGILEPKIVEVTNKETIYKLENPPLAPANGITCSLTLNQNSIDIGEQVSGTIHDGVDILCEVYAKKDGGAWSKVFEGKTDISGDLKHSDTMNLDGTYVFKAICGRGTAKECITNDDTLIVRERDCNAECIENDFYASGIKVSDCSQCTDADEHCLTIFESTCCCTLRTDYAPEQYSLLTCGVTAVASGYDKWTLGILNSFECITHADSQCVAEGSTGSAGQQFFSPNCCTWKCQREGAYHIGSCISYAQTNLFYGGAAITDDGSIWTTENCNTYARNDCTAQGLGFNNDDMVDDNCCMWNCVGYSPDECSALTIENNYEGFNQDPRTAEECRALGELFCPYTGETLQSFYWAEPNCCMWNCWLDPCLAFCPANNFAFGRSSLTSGCGDFAAEDCVDQGFLAFYFDEANCCCWNCYG